MTLRDFVDPVFVRRKAEEALAVAPMHITDHIAPLSEGGPHDYYSNGDYWWPDPTKPDGLPYIQRDGQSNPDNFGHHRTCLRAMRTAVASLAMGYRLFGDERYAAHAVRILKEFFLDEATCMAPHLTYAQAIPGKCSGRGLGIIDTLHLTELPAAIDALRPSPAMTETVYTGLQQWFAAYLLWMDTHPNGIAERDYKNNHAICWHVQAAAFARFTGDTAMLEACRQRYKDALLPRQMREDGAFTDELKRTKPYGYSIFVLDNLAVLAWLLCDEDHDLWHFALPDGRGVEKGLAFLLPYLQNKDHWFLPPDVEHFESWPARAPFMVLAGLQSGNRQWLDLYNALPEESHDPEVRRNLGIRWPALVAEWTCPRRFPL